MVLALNRCCRVVMQVGEVASVLEEKANMVAVG